MHGEVEAGLTVNPGPEDGTVPAGTDRAPLLRIEDVEVHFRGPRRGTVVRALDGVSLELFQGVTVALVGESGSGKTMLSRAMLGLLPKGVVKCSGRVLLGERDLLSEEEASLRQLWGREISMVLQDSMTSLNPVRKVGAQISDVLRHHLDRSRREARAEAVELLRSVGIPSPEQALRSYPHQLSGGMRQRVVIAISLACSPRLLVADEPTTALDVTVQAQILELLGRQRRERDMGMVLVTHDLNVAAVEADEIVVMYAGQIVERAGTNELFENTRMPYSEALLQAIPRADAASGRVLRAVPGEAQLSAADRRPAGCRFAARCVYAQERCLEEEPPLLEERSAGAGGRAHLFRCWYPVGTSAGAEALQSNRRRGRTAAGLELTAETAGAPQ